MYGLCLVGVIVAATVLGAPTNLCWPACWSTSSSSTVAVLVKRLGLVNVVDREPLLADGLLGARIHGELPESLVRLTRVSHRYRQVIAELGGQDRVEVRFDLLLRFL